MGIKRNNNMKKIVFALYVAIVSCILFSCEESLESRIDKKLSTMSEMSELGTVEYTISKIVKANDNSFYTIGDRKILFSCQATMKAGIDLANFSADSIKVDEAKKSVVVNLPKPIVLSFNMPADKIHLEYQKVGTLRSDFTAEDRNALLKQAEEAIMADAPNLGILKDAEHNAKLFFEALFSQIGFESIEVNYK